MLHLIFRRMGEASLTIACAGFLMCSFEARAVEESPAQVMYKACQTYVSHKTVNLKAQLKVETKTKGGDIQLDVYTTLVTAKMPNKFRALHMGDVAGDIFFDGKTLTVRDRHSQVYLRRELVGDLNDLLTASFGLSLQIPMLSLILAKDCTMESGSLVAVQGGFSERDGEEDLEHLIFHSQPEDIEWHIWIRKSPDRYFIRKMRVLSRRDISVGYEFLLLSENLDGEIADAVFEPDDSATYSKVWF